MTKEKLSALIDGELEELDERRMFKELAQDPELRGVWERYHLIRAAMTRQLGVLAAGGLPERIMARLETEPERAAAPLRFWPLAAGFAAAASVAAVAILSLQTIQPASGPTAASPARLAASVGISNSTTTVASSNPSATVAPVSAAVADPEDRLNLYLVGHNEFMPTAGMGGMLPYVRVVAHTQDK